MEVEALTAFARLYGVVRYFHPSDAVTTVSWGRFLVHGCERMATTPSREQIAPRLKELFDPMVVGLSIGKPGAAASMQATSGARVEWRHLGYGAQSSPDQAYSSWRTNRGSRVGNQAGFGDSASAHADPIFRVILATGIEAQVPLSLPLAGATTGQSRQVLLNRLSVQLLNLSLPAEPVSAAQARADVIEAWNAARHFYPYWTRDTSAWDAALPEWIAAQPPRQSRAALRDSLRGLLALLGDGHVRVDDSLGRLATWYLPVSIRPAGADWIVYASSIDEVRAGDVLETVDGRPVDEWARESMMLQSGSPQGRRWAVAGELAGGIPESEKALGFRRGEQRFKRTLRHERQWPAAAPSLPAIRDLGSSTFYVDLSRFRQTEFNAVKASLAAARGIVFDLRGYPSPEAKPIVAYWLKKPDDVRWLAVPRFVGPFGAIDQWKAFGWNVAPDPALAAPRKVMLIDGRAISFAESIIGYFAGQHAGRIIGEPSAGANGNVVQAKLPSGISFRFTGMRATRQDGTLFHSEGFQPDEIVIPTSEGIRDGRDEVLERAVRYLTRFVLEDQGD